MHLHQVQAWRCAQEESPWVPPSQFGYVLLCNLLTSAAGQPPPLVEFLKKLDELIVPPKFTLPHPGPQNGEDASNRVRVFESREEM